jgi:hypothetical protein
VSIGFVLNEFAALGITFTPATLSKSDLFLELLPLVNTGRVELLDDPTLRAQLLVLERRAVRGGKDSVDHPRGAHDDVANAVAGALVHVTGVGVKRKRQVIFSFGDGPVGLDPAPAASTAEDARAAWERRQRESIAALVRLEEERGVRRHERDRRAADATLDVERLGASELVDLLLDERRGR